MENSFTDHNKSKMSPRHIWLFRVAQTRVAKQAIQEEKAGSLMTAWAAPSFLHTGPGWGNDSPSTGKAVQLTEHLKNNYQPQFGAVFLWGRCYWIRKTDFTQMYRHLYNSGKLPLVKPPWKAEHWFQHRQSPRHLLKFCGICLQSQFYDSRKKNKP